MDKKVWWQKWMTLVLGSVVLFTPLLLTGCGEEAPPEDVAHEEAEESGGHSEEGGGHEEEEHASAIKAPMDTLASRETLIEMPDKQLIYGRVYSPDLKPLSEDQADEWELLEAHDEEEEDGHSAAHGKGKPHTKFPLVILLHSLNGSSGDWGEFPYRLTRKGYSVFAMDLRGHGKSNKKKGGGRISWRHFSKADWEKIYKDIDSVLKYFSASPRFTYIDTEKVGFIGASLGANVAINAGSHNNDAVKAIAALSPGLKYKGVSVQNAMVGYTHAMFITASQEDTYAFDSSKTIYHWTIGPKIIRLYKKVGHGTDMLKYHAPLTKQVLEWLGTHLKGNLKGVPLLEPPPPPGAHAPPKKDPATKASTKGKDAGEHHGEKKPSEHTNTHAKPDSHGHKDAAAGAH
ncbi:MAG: alpha/beta hydrolase [Vampirovibrio sp.]|nr:alpha/beta hydrolase [Vampirovibrio sp.]